MDALALEPLIFVALVFMWSGFVRSALGFGGAALTLPLFLLVLDSPVEVLPIIAIHLIIFGSIAVGFNFKHVNWRYLGHVLPWMLPFKIIGVIGLLSLPNTWLTLMVYVIAFIYGLNYIFQVKLKVNSPWFDKFSLALGSYISGTALIGAPLLVGVFAKHNEKAQLRDTLFILWIIMVSIKLIGFVVTGTDLNLKWALYMLPVVAVGHVLGLKAHEKIVSLSQVMFLRVIGVAMLLVCLAGLVNQFFN